MAKKFKEYELLEDIIIPKGTIFSEFSQSHYVGPITGIINDGMRDATISIVINDDVLDESGDKFKET